MSRLNSSFDKWLQRPMRGEKGLHQDMFTAAAFLFEEGWNKSEIFAMIKEAVAEVDARFIPDREIYSAIDYAWRRVNDAASPGMAWPPVDLHFRNEILKLYRADMDRLRASVPSHDWTAWYYVQWLYRADDLVCLGKTAYDFRTVRVGDIPKENRDLGDCEFINPSPMSALAGLTADNEWSTHAKSNTGPRVYVVIEFDSGELHEHAAILKYLATHLPLVLIVFSGSSSLHGWFKTTHASEQIVTTFFTEAVTLGADPKMFSPCQFSRLPMGTHGGTGKRQRVIYFNAERTYHQ